ncbi:hypothetical protein GIX45_22380 [Erwinia sp. CPCC 100877]|nr:hypothetical protein [Erwinia sp. CPCC 100877]
MATITTGVVLMRWQLLSALLMFFASTLNIQFRRSESPVLAVLCTGLGIAASCWFATGLLGMSLDFAAIWINIKEAAMEVMSHTPPDWPIVMT